MSNNISIKLDLQKITGAIIAPHGAKGAECLIIPIEFAGLYKGAKGIYLDLTAIPLTQARADSKDTHIVKQSFSKEKYLAMSEEQKKTVPIIGNAIVWGETATESKPAQESGGSPSWM
jgi:hypothetical protein